MDLTEKRMLLLRQRGHLLHRPRGASPVDVARHVVGIQAQSLPAAALAIRARSEEAATAVVVEHALAVERSVVRTWGMRGTLHLMASEDYPWLLPLVAEGALRGSYRRLAQEGLPADGVPHALQLLEQVLANGPLTRHEIAEGLASRGLRMEGQAPYHLVRLAALRGTLCYGPHRNGEPALVLLGDWLGIQPGQIEETSVVRLVRRYLASHGPAAPEDFAHWSGLRLRDVKRAWGRLASELVEARAPGRSLWMLRGGDDAPRNVARLIPAFDPYLLGWKSRQPAVAGGLERRIFPGGGIVRPAIVTDGAVVGTWSLERNKREVVVSTEPFSSPPARIRRMLTTEAEDVARFHRASSGVDPGQTSKRR